MNDYEEVCAARDCDAPAITSLNNIPFCAIHVPMAKPMRRLSLSVGRETALGRPVAPTNFRGWKA